MKIVLLVLLTVSLTACAIVLLRHLHFMMDQEGAALTVTLPYSRSSPASFGTTGSLTDTIGGSGNGD
jgi:hypothetical protein